MPTPSINIGICNKGKSLVQSIDTHFHLHEPKLYNAVLSSTIGGVKGEFIFEEIINEKYEISDKEDIDSWIEYGLYPKINNLGNSNSIIILNILIHLEEENSIDILKSLLISIKKLQNQKLNGVFNIRLFAMIYPLEEKSNNSSKSINERLEALKLLTKDFENELHDVYFIDNKNIDTVPINLNTSWLAFALSEFFVLQMVGPNSLPLTGKNKIFGLGIIHFNEVLFREVISNKILEYKFEEESIDDDKGVQIQDIYNKCNPFVSVHQNFFHKFIEMHPFSKENEMNLEDSVKKYILDFKSDLNDFVTNEKNKIGESKAILANLIGEDDEKLEGID